METKPSTTIHSDAFLKREQFIYGAGCLMILSPAGNFIWTAALTGNPRWYTPMMLLDFARNVPMTFWFLWASAFAVGCMMVAGGKSPWKFAIGILAINVLFGFYDLKHDLQYGVFQPLLSLFINTCLLSLIYFQEFHRNLEFKRWQERLTRSFPTRKTLKEIPAVFDGVGEWAKLVEINPEQISFRCLEKQIPPEIEVRPLMIALSNELSVEVRFASKDKHYYRFNFVSLNEAELLEIKRLQAKLAA